MSGTPFETLLEPISQPALGHEIVVGLIKAERTMRSHHWNTRAWHIPKSNLPGAYRLRNAEFIDAYVLVIEWGRTTVDVVQHALRAAPLPSGSILGAVLNKADVKA